METIYCELHPEMPIYIGLFINVTNAVELKESLKELSCSFLNPKLISNIQHVLLAVTRSVYAKDNKSSKTNSMYLDVVYYLSGSSNIRESLKKFGISENSQSIIMIAFELGDFERAKDRIHGSLVELSCLKELSDFEGICKEFRIGPNEKNLNEGIAQAVLSRVAIKDL